MSLSAPKLDPRSTSDIVTDVADLLVDYTTSPTPPAAPYDFAPWKRDPVTLAPAGASAALIGIFARLAEVVISRLNQVPDKNFLAFLDLLGAARLPPEPARVPLTFLLAAGRTESALVPAGTKVAAQPEAGDTEPVVFEVERPLLVTAAQLATLFTLDPEHDAFTDSNDRAPEAESFPVFRGERAVEHVLYLGDSRLLGYEKIDGLSLFVDVGAAVPADPDPREVVWEYWDGAGWRTLAIAPGPGSDGTQKLTRTGVIQFGNPIPALPESAVNERVSRWIRARLLTPITLLPDRVTGMVRRTELPSIRDLELSVELQLDAATGLTPDLGFTNGVPIDLSKEFFAFGEKPKQYDTLYLASLEAFSKDRAGTTAPASAKIRLLVELANSHLASAASVVRPSSDLQLVWEVSVPGGAWQAVGRSSAPDWLALLEVGQVTIQDLPAATGLPGPALTVQGTAQKGATVSAVKLSRQSVGEGVALAVVLDTEGRFAVRAEGLAAGVDVIELSAQYKGRNSKAWGVGATGTAGVTLAARAPVAVAAETATSVMVEIDVSGTGGPITLRVTNQASDTTVELPNVPVTATPTTVNINVPVSPGRNELLLEALQGTLRVGATTLMVARSVPAPVESPEGFSDGTFGFTQSGVVTLRLPETVATLAVNGLESDWLRVRLVRGDYGRAAGYVLKDPLKPDQGFTLIPETFRAPVVARLRIGYQFTDARPPEDRLILNHLTFEDVSGATLTPFTPFQTAPDQLRPALYLGFTLPAQQRVSPQPRKFPNSGIGLYASPAAVRYGEPAGPLSPDTSTLAVAARGPVTHSFTVTNFGTEPDTFVIEAFGSEQRGWATRVFWAATPDAALVIAAGASAELKAEVTIPLLGSDSGDSDIAFLRVSRASSPDGLLTASVVTALDAARGRQPPKLIWQYWNGSSFSRLTVLDESRSFLRPGVLEFLAPPDFAAKSLFGRERFWLRVVFEEGDYPNPPELRQLLLNTTLAAQNPTVLNEVLGSSNGSAEQVFRSTRVPVLGGQRLEVRELEEPSSEDQKTIALEEGADAIRRVLDSAGRPREIWVRWHEVSDFYASSARDRHYVLDHLTGEIRFGNGTRGRIPPVGSGNLRLARYQTGGGSTGNRAAGKVNQLKTTVPYIEKVVNPEPAVGGAESETIEALFERVPRTLRHGDRAVTLEDYEDLALLASPEVARSACVPLRDLASDALGATARPGVVSVIVVPRTTDIKPLPTLDLVEDVRSYLQERAPATALAVVVGPLYIRVDVRAEVSVVSASEASSVQQKLLENLASFLHPLSGGLDKRGWNFGRAPHRSDVLALIESVPGLDHVRFLEITETEELPGARQTGRFLVFSGQHQIDLVFEEP